MVELRTTIDPKKKTFVNENLFDYIHHVGYQKTFLTIYHENKNQYRLIFVAELIKSLFTFNQRTSPNTDHLPIYLLCQIRNRTKHIFKIQCPLYGFEFVVICHSADKHKSCYTHLTLLPVSVSINLFSFEFDIMMLEKRNA